MSDGKYQRSLIKEFHIRQEGSSLFIDGAEGFSDEMDYANREMVKVLATKAVHTANGFAELVSNNCNTKEPNAGPNGHLEIYLSIAALACEIYMKSIIYNENLNEGKMVRGHCLDELYVKLPSRVQMTLKDKFSRIEEILRSVRDTFERLRYNFEQFDIDGNYLVIFQLMDELKTISNSYPKTETGFLSYANGNLYLG